MLQRNAVRSLPPRRGASGHHQMVGGGSRIRRLPLVPARATIDGSTPRNGTPVARRGRKATGPTLVSRATDKEIRPHVLGWRAMGPRRPPCPSPDTSAPYARLAGDVADPGARPAARATAPDHPGGTETTQCGRRRPARRAWLDDARVERPRGRIRLRRLGGVGDDVRRRPAAGRGPGQQPGRVQRPSVDPVQRGGRQALDRRRLPAGRAR